MTSVTEYTVTLELISLEDITEKCFNCPFYIEVFMGNSRKRTQRLTFAKKDGEILNLRKTVVTISPLLKGLEVWFREEVSHKFLVKDAS